MVDKYITLAFAGGLGNQLFQVAAGETISRMCGRRLVFAECTSGHSDHSSRNYFLSIIKAWENTAPTGTFSNTTAVNERVLYDYTDTWPALLSNMGSVTLGGYFQNYRYISNDFSSRLQLSHVPPLPQNMAYIHVRGGDFVNYWNRPIFDMGLNDGRSSYYLRAIEMFPDDTTFLLFTNDCDYALKAHWLPSVSHRVLFAPPSNEEQTLATMVACPRGGICPNSTFAWWAAWIGHGQGCRRYVLPDRWVNIPSVESVEGLYFPGATVLSV